MSKIQQWRERITSKELAERFGMTESMAEILRKHRLRWLGHIARMDDNRMPKQLLFGELVRPRPSHGPKRRWRDLSAGDVLVAGLGGTWYEVAQDRREWEYICKHCHTNDNFAEQQGVVAPSNIGRSYICSYGRSFRRSGDLTRHRHFCDGSQHQSHRQVVSTFECLCGRIFRRRGDLTRHSRYCRVLLHEPPDL